MQKSFIYFENLKQIDKILIGLYSIFSFLVLVICSFAQLELKKNLLIIYIALSQLGLYFFLYVSLRNFKSYLIWLAFGIAHLLLFFILRKNAQFEMPSGNAASGLGNTTILLLLFQLFRYFSLQTQKREFVAPVKGGGKDLIENVKISSIDFVICLLYMLSWAGLNFLAITYNI